MGLDTQGTYASGVRIHSGQELFVTREDLLVGTVFVMREDLGTVFVTREDFVKMHLYVPCLNQFHIWTFIGQLDMQFVRI